MGTIQQTTDKSFRASVNGKTLEIFISEKEVKQDATASAVPKGHREIAPEGGAQMWNRNEEFRE
ncbi:MAG: hypothetical protein ACRDF4_06070, partial [Rhabdochlamydiaceae bacterium]